MRGEQTHRVSRVHRQSLLFRHVAQIVHNLVILSPVGEHRTVTSVGHQFLRELGHTSIKVVHDHKLDAGRLLALSRIHTQRIRLHLVLSRVETTLDKQTNDLPIHVDMAVCLKLLSKLRSQNSVIFLREVTKSILYSSYELFLVQYHGSLRSMGNVRI